MVVRALSSFCQVSDSFLRPPKLNVLTKRSHWFNEAIEEKASRRPDAETGLVPCGCGGEPEYITSYDQEAGKDVVKVYCKKCTISINFSFPGNKCSFGAMKEDARTGWNRAMGWYYIDHSEF